ncbi:MULTISPECIES: hypothetical protein [Serratia]|uniref:hypothetical protein n=1 Tax=Serratia TaxID=613 RepID=UPI000D161FA3|nr:MULTISPECIES: hypothetical protein [Serratia]MDS0826521.1 hypothetical protein [Serratia marcescens]PTA80848.1 hypothetical protein C9411_04915 [Serratia sp. Nf2]PYA05889.1 hypothetical protein DMW43_10255 [Serratia marcescens]PYA50610.1 hypothetical protein DMW45_05135 [Serratia marcescens]
MAGKQQKTDNSKFISIAGNNSKYSDLTTEGKAIVIDIISKCAGKKGYPKEKVYYVLFNCTEISRDRVKYWLQYYPSDDSMPSENTVRKFLTITKQLSEAMVDAHTKGIKLFKTSKAGHYYPTTVQKYQLDKLYSNGGSAQEMIEVLQKMIDDAK